MLDSITDRFLGIWRAWDEARLRDVGPSSGRAGFVGVQPTWMHRLQAQPSPVPGAMLNFGQLEILHNFIFELGFCKRSPTEQWNMHVSRGDLHSSLPPYSQITFTVLHEHRMSGDSPCGDFSKTHVYDRVMGRVTALKDCASVPTRTCLKMQKKGNGF